MGVGEIYDYLDSLNVSVSARMISQAMDLSSSSTHRGLKNLIEKRNLVGFTRLNGWMKKGVNLYFIKSKRRTA